MSKIPMALPWPALAPLDSWNDTVETVHRWTQIVGKLRLERGPWVNHSWGSTLYVSARGLTTSMVPYGDRAFEVEFNFVDHRLEMRTSDRRSQAFDLEPMSVAAFYRRINESLEALDLDVPIFAQPVEVEDATPFAEDEGRTSYDAEAVHAFWTALVRTNHVFKTYRAGFIGKSSPSHFFWGAFDLAVTRFSGRTAPPHPGGAPNCPDWIMREAYSHELASAGFWPGAGLGEAAYYAYAYPEPEGYASARVQPKAAYYHADLREYVLPYEAVRTAADPDAALLSFLESTYAAAADLADWPREELEWNGPDRED